jgi:hypothetical protein
VQTQKDHVEAYSFLMGRMSAALVVGDAGAGEQPARRSWVGFVVGVLLALLITGGFFLYGLISHEREKAAGAAGQPGGAVVQGLPVVPASPLLPATTERG